MKKYTHLFAFLFTLLIAACSEPEIVRPAEARKRIDSNATETPFYFVLKLQKPTQFRVLFRHEETSPIQYSLRYRIAYKDNTYHILGTQQYRATNSNNGTIAAFAYPKGANLKKPHCFRVEVTRGGVYVGDFEVK